MNLLSLDALTTPYDPLTSLVLTIPVFLVYHLGILLVDMRNGAANGFPPLHKGMSRTVWKNTFMQAYLDFCKQVDAADGRARRDRGRTLDELPLDPYAAESPAEFFAVISEAFFEMPADVNEAFPAVYQQLRLFYRQDPLLRYTAH